MQILALFTIHTDNNFNKLLTIDACKQPVLVLMSSRIQVFTI